MAATGDTVPVSVSAEHFMWFVDNALDQMAVVLRELGDDLANVRPDIEGANSPFAILTHCLGVMEFWGGAAIADRPVQRDRDAEFIATGEVADLLARAGAARRQLESDLARLPAAPQAPTVVAKGSEPFYEDKGAVLVHVLEELYQHLGQMELTRDLLLSDQ
ncbi:MAG TPA: DinB family protein [Acidimicrobiales bacterium]|jgi:hypothetical protein